MSKIETATRTATDIETQTERGALATNDRVIQHNCARSYEWTIAALETGVERRAEVVCLQEPPRERGGIGISHLAYEIRKTKRVWTAIRRGSGLVVD